MNLPDRFSAIPVQVTLDGSGYGVATFQPSGKNVRVTNLFVKVSSSNNQATCTIYKGQVADGNALSNTNSGSTGAPATGAIDLFDGETLYVVWRGGDPGATATATLTGASIPFDQVGSFVGINWADPIAAGDGSLIYPALKSPDYVAGVDGWMIGRDGSAEFNDIFVRGELYVAGQDGSYIWITDSGGTPFIQLRPDDTSIPYNYRQALIYAYSANNGSDDTSLELESPSYTTNGGTSKISLEGERSNGSTPYVGITPALEIGTHPRQFTGATMSSTLVAIAQRVTNTAAIGAEALVTTTADVFGAPTSQFLANSAYEVLITGRWQPSNTTTPRLIARVRKTNLVGQLLQSFGRLTCISVEPYEINLRGIFTVGAANVSANLAFTINSGSAAGVNDVLTLGSAGSPLTVEVRYLGNASDYPSNNVIV